MIMKQCVDSGQWVRVVYIMSYKGTYKHQCTAQGDVFPQLTTGCQQFPEQQTKSDHHQPEGTSISLSPSLSLISSHRLLSTSQSQEQKEWEWCSDENTPLAIVLTVKYLFKIDWLRVLLSVFLLTQSFTIRYWQTSDLTAWEKFPPSCEIQYLWMSSSFYNSY